MTARRVRGPGADLAQGPRRGLPAPAAEPQAHRLALAAAAVSPASGSSGAGHPRAAVDANLLPIWHPARTALRAVPPRTRWRRRWGAPVLQLLVVCTLLVVGAASVDAMRTVIAQDVAADSGAGPKVALVPARHRVSPPVSIEVGRIGVRSTLVDLRKLPNGTLQVPTDFAKAGWWVQGPRPGDPGPAVIVGHVDSYKGPGVFYKLGQLRIGDLVTIRRADRTTAQFVVQQVRSVAKRSFPTSLVYGGKKAGLRLITCGGQFDRRTGHYLSNTIVFAAPYTAPKAPPAPAVAKPGVPVPAAAPVPAPVHPGQLARVGLR